MMWIFIWEATEDSNAWSQTFHSFDDAWEDFKDLTIDKWPDYFFKFTPETPNDVEHVSWSEFINENSEYNN